MQVSELSGNKLKITLTHTEVICCFGAYEKLLSMSAKTKTAIKILLGDIIEEYYGVLGNQKISAEIRTSLHNGCVIVLSYPESFKKPKEYLICFENSENLIEGAIGLYRILSKKAYTSSLYTMNKKYYILLSYGTEKRRIMPLRKFSHYITDDAVKAEYIKEHGKVISKRNALGRLCSAFIKET